MNIVALNSKWEQRLKDLIQKVNDRVVIYKKGGSVDAPSNYDSFFDESTDPNSPDSVAREPYSTKDVYGIVVLNPSLSPKNDGDIATEIGFVNDKIILFSCLHSDVDEGNGYTSFDGAEYVYVDKTEKKYKVKKIINNGFLNAYETIVLLEEMS